MKAVFGLDLPIIEWSKEEGIADEEIRERITEKVDAAAARKAAELGPDLMRQIEKGVLLQTLDQLWREHLIMLEHLRQAVGLRGYAQRDPLNEYKSESFTLFEAMLARLRVAVTEQLMHVQLAPNQGFEMEMEALPEMYGSHVNPMTGEDEFEMARGGDRHGRPAGAQIPSGGGGPAPVRNRGAQAAADPNDPAHGARSRATHPVPAARARNSNIATAHWLRNSQFQGVEPLTPHGLRHAYYSFSSQGSCYPNNQAAIQRRTTCRYGEVRVSSTLG